VVRDDKRASVADVYGSDPAGGTDEGRPARRVPAVQGEAGAAGGIRTGVWA
jgi:hypothetical protein